jgi:hypothetical protein
MKNYFKGSSMEKRLGNTAVDGHTRLYGLVYETENIRCLIHRLQHAKSLSDPSFNFLAILHIKSENLEFGWSVRAIIRHARNKTLVS